MSIMESKFIIYFPADDTYLYTLRTKVKAKDIAKKYSSPQAAKQAVTKSEWKHEKYVILPYD